MSGPALALPRPPAWHQLGRRSAAPELMDTLPADEQARCLADLAQVNRLTFTHRATLAWLARETRGWAPGTEVRVLDVASGHGDLLRAIHRRLARRGLVPRLEGLDLSPAAQSAARAATPASLGIAWTVADVFAHRPQPRPDFIVSSQFAHHLDAAQLARFLGWLEAQAGRGWFIADLHRHPLALLGFAVLARAARWHAVVRHDGCVSVARALTPAEWRALLQAQGIAAGVHRHWPFRLGISRRRDPPPTLGRTP